MKTQGASRDVVSCPVCRPDSERSGGSLKDLSAIDLGGGVTPRHPAVQRVCERLRSRGLWHALRTSADAIYSMACDLGALRITLHCPACLRQVGRG